MSVLTTIVEEEWRLKCEEVALLLFFDLAISSPSQGNKIETREVK